MAVSNCDLAVYYSFAYALMIFVGGLIGFIVAKSKASIIASSVIALVVLLLDYVTLKVNMVAGECASLLLAVVLCKMFKDKYDNPGKKAGQGELAEPLEGEAPKKKFMPMGLLTVMSFMYVGILVNALVAPSR
eukprot:TRINITY_DN96004_c0_g1_i1.p1 TRINITY_DN96004_c0_g1~~TRINITY_DN96004_c0_g1_i1.p1  ORF type:complete len:133 (+),score=30.54 TRINITY_DN96004_c0_g1_i1:59-457(+)